MPKSVPSNMCLALLLGALPLAGCRSPTGNAGAPDADATATETAGDPGHPNALFIVIDTLRRDRLGCYGYQRDTSPNIDRLASRSIVFDRAFANSDGTILTHISLLSSRYTAPRETAPGPTQTLAEAFSQAGYATYGVTANPTLVASAGWARGFDRYTDQPVDIATLDQIKDDPNYSRQIEVRSADQTTDFVLRALRRHREKHPDRPWFLFVNYLDPHDPYTERKPYSDQFRESASNISGTLRPTEGRTIWSWVAETLPTLGQDDVRRLGELYDAEVRYTDTHLQRVFDYLAETGQDADTVVLLTSDHGEALGEHDMFSHMLACFDVEIKVPFVLAVPWLTETQVRSYELIESVDVGPTLLTLCHIPVPEVFQGRALIDAEGRLRRTGRSYTRHTHHAVNGKQRRELDYPPEAALNSIVLRFADSKLYFLADGAHMLFDISRYPQRTKAREFKQLVPLLNRGDSLPGQLPAELSPEALEALRSLGYVQ